jgi:hypothetical protein
MYKRRRHHNNKGYRQIKRGQTERQVRKMIRKLGLANLKPNKKVMKSITIASTVLFLLALPAYGGDYEKIGLGFTIAKEANMLGWQSENYEYEYVKAFIAFNKELSTNWWVSIEPGVGFHRAWNGKEDKYGMSIGADGWFNYNLWNISKNNTLYMGPGVGTMTIFPWNDQPELSDSGIFCMFGGRIGNLYKGKSFMMDVSISAEHFSDPFHTDDAGRNFVMFKLTFYKKG